MDNLELSNQEKKGIIEDYTIKIKELESKILRYQNLINKFKNSLGQKPASRPNAFTEALGSIVSNAKETIIEKPDVVIEKTIPRQNWKQIVLNALKEINAFSTTTEIYEFLIDKSPEFIGYDKGDVISKLSTALSNLYSKEAIARVKNTIGRGYFWALPAWYSPELIGVYKSRLCKKYSVMETTFFPEPEPPKPPKPPVQ